MEEINVSKLPKKVQRYIQSLEIQIKEKENYIEGLQKETEESNIYYFNNPIKNDKIFIPKHKTIRFELQNKGYIDVSIDYNNTEYINIRSKSTLNIIPYACNSANVTNSPF